MNVVFTTVIRATAPGEAHGGLWFADPSTGRARCALAWDLPVSGHPRGGPRGLRGVAWHRDRLWVASFDAVLELDAQLSLCGVHRHPSLAHAHQIAPWGDQLLVVSTAFDAVLALDTVSGAWTWGLSVRGHPDDPVIEMFDPAEPRQAGDSTHLNMVHASPGQITVSGTRLRLLVGVRDGRAEALSALPFGTHDARPTRHGVLYSDTERDQVVWGDLAIPVPRMHPDRLTHLAAADGMARAAFARGLLQIDDHTAIGGASPAGLHRYDRHTATATPIVHTTPDVRASVHGLAHWPHPLPDTDTKSARALSSDPH